MEKYPTRAGVDTLVDPVSPMSHVSRRQKDGGCKDMPCPLPVKDYNGNMNAADHSDLSVDGHTSSSFCLTLLLLIA